MEFQFIVVIQTQNKNFDMVKTFEALFLFSFELSCSEENKKRASKVLTVRFIQGLAAYSASLY